MSDKRDKLKEVAPHIWSMYQHVMEGRSKLENRLNYFLAIDTLLLLGLLQLCQIEVTSLRVLYLVPCFLLFIPILLLLGNFLAQPLRGSWIDRGDLITYLERDDFYLQWIADMFSCAAGSDMYRKRTVKLLYVCIISVGASLTWLTGLFLMSICKSAMNDVEIGIILAVVVATGAALVWVLLLGQKEFPYREHAQEMAKCLENWITRRSDNQ